VNLTRLDPSAMRRKLQLRLIASSGTRFVTYHGVGSERYPIGGATAREGKWDAMMDLSPTIEDCRFFYPFTTTLIEIRLNREPYPMTGYNDVTWFLPRQRGGTPP
jgi:hypothetical protein